MKFSIIYEAQMVDISRKNEQQVFHDIVEQSLYAEEMGLAEGATVEVKVSGRKLILAAAQPEYSLEVLVAAITPKNRHAETDWGAPVGKETW